MGWLDRAAGWVRSKGQDAVHGAIDIGKGAVLPVQSIGAGIVDIVESPFKKDEYSSFLGTIYGVAQKRLGEAMQEALGPNSGVGAGIRALPEGVRSPARSVIGPALRGSERAYNDVVSRPLAAALTAGSIASAPHGGGVLGLFKGDNWREAWDRADAISPGQAFALAIGTKNINDPVEVQRFAATDHYKQWSGMADAVIRLELDPTVIAGKVASGLRAGRLAVPVTQEGIAAARDSTRVARFVQRVDDIVAKDGEGAAARIRSELFPDHAEGAYYADLLASAPDTVARRKVVGSLLGSAQDYADLVESAPDIAHQIRNLTSDTLEAVDRERGMLRPGRVEQLDTEIQALYPKVDDLSKLQATYATLDEIPGRSYLSQARAGISSSGFYQKNPLTAPVRTISNMLPQHWLNLNDSRSDIQVNRMLQQSRLPVERQAELRSMYMTAVDAPARQRIAIQAEEEAVSASLAHHGVPKEMVDDVIAQARRGRQESMGALSRRKYDANGRGSIVVPGADGTVERIHLPLHVTQQANLLPLADINEVERAAQGVRGLFPGAGPRARYRAARLGASGSTAAKKIAAFSDLPAQSLEAFYSVWRPATLLRAGWPVRILGDEQLRILSKIGAMAQMKTLATGAVRDVKQRLTPWELRLDDGELLKGRGLPSLAKATPEQVAAGVVKRGIGDYETTILTRYGDQVTLPPAFGAPGDAANYVKRLNSSAGTFRDLVMSDEGGILRELRKGTGSWTSIAGDSGEHAPAWTGAVNKQIKQSAFAREALAGKSVEEMTSWLASTDEGIAYARQMGWSPATFESHAADVLDQVHRYVPTEGMRAKLLDRNLTYNDLERAIPDKTLRPAVHGEEMAQAFGKSPILDHVRTIRDGLFKWLGAQPTDVLSRNPYFDAMYRAEGERLINVYAEALQTGSGLYDEAIRTIHPAVPGTPAVLEPGAVVGPAGAGLPPLFHGTSRDLGSALGDRYSAGRSAENLFGPGFYTTEDRTIAGSYTRKGAGAERNVYGVKWGKDAPPKLIDLDATAHPDLREAIRSMSDGLDDTYALSQVIDNPNATGVELVRAFREDLSNSGLTTFDADEYMHDVADELVASGWDGLQHVGGRYASNGGPEHNVRIFFEPENLSVSRVSDRLVAGTPGTPAVTERVRTPRTMEQALPEIADKARRFALNESQKLLYDLAEKSKFAHMLRFISPFYMAFQEVLTRWAGIAVDNPAYVARARLVWDAPEKAGVVTDEHGYRIDENGVAWDPVTDKRVGKDVVGKDRYITLPFGIPGLPTQGPVRMNKKSMNIALSGFSFGPPVAVAVNELVKDKPSLEDSAKWALPYGAVQNSLSLLLPASAKRAYALSQKEDDRQYANQMLRLYYDRMTDYMLGKRADKPTYAEVKKDADALAKVRTVASWVLPFAPIFDSPYQPHINAYRNAQERVRKEAEKGNQAPFGTNPDGSPVSVDNWFIDTYGEEYFWLTRSLSKSNDGVQPTKEGFAARQRYQDLIEKHPDLGSVIIGNEGAGAYSPGVYRYQQAHDTRPGSGVRQRGGYTFEEGAANPEVDLGWIKYGQAMDVIDAERVKRGLPNLNVKAAADLADIKRQITQALEQKYPSWADEFAQQDEKKWDKRIKGLREVAADPRLNRPDRPDIAGLREYLRARDAVVAELQKRQHHSLTSTSNMDLADTWQSLKAAIVEKYVAFAPMFYRYLERDPMEAMP